MDPQVAIWEAFWPLWRRCEQLDTRVISTAVGRSRSRGFKLCSVITALRGDVASGREEYSRDEASWYFEDDDAYLKVDDGFAAASLNNDGKKKKRVKSREE
ncbi:hypothetical protein EYF80_011224 [Liparis tanakae]|uniref:Uncharacterized protein n=1 Tax=Liparis tanakae TaxID=230148 RepID=A0A4Z2IKT9_9TELE|nr:hypothetical protein EYF80_011224 [Liparis tanakae]